MAQTNEKLPTRGAELNDRMQRLEAGPLVLYTQRLQHRWSLNRRLFETSEAELGSKISLVAVHIGGQAELVSSAIIRLPLALYF